ncbi:hypothetical protein GH714_015963 [Hevea brasiliensis]|uniref:Squalene monooxygenase n=1 Tax=Hevea brasiliensis TaxID=3981 RepID=A0A6A6K6H9_HEVBR|nr:hypothetical protein GH714_015963 [Hevea brasiliensis]
MIPVSIQLPPRPQLYRSFSFLYKTTPPSPPFSPRLATSPPPGITVFTSRKRRQSSILLEATKETQEPVIFSSASGACFGDYINMAFVIDKFILGTFFASLCGFFLLCILRRNRQNLENKRKFKEKAVFKTQNDNVRTPEDGSGPDVIIVGAGVAGAALACTLGKEGRQVHMIERDLTEPDRIVGELLQPGGYLKLIELGLEDCVEEIDAQRVLGYALFKNVQGTVTSLLEENGTIRGVQYKTKDGQELRAYAPLTVICDGCFSNLRRSLCNPKVDVPSCFVGLVLENCQLPFANHGHVILADPSPILFYPISSTEVRCLVDIPGQKVPPIANGEMAKYLKDVSASGIIFPIIKAEGVRQMFFPATVPAIYRHPPVKGKSDDELKSR